MLQKPEINFCFFMNGFEGNAQFYGIVNVEKPVPARKLQAFQNLRLIAQFLAVGAKSVSFYFQRLTGFLQGFLKGSADSHHLSYRFHLQTELTVSARKFIEVPAGYFYNHIIQSWLKKGRSGFRDLVFKLVEVVTYGQLGRNFSDWIPGSFGRQRGGAGNPGVNFYGNDIFFFIGAYGKLHVAAAGKIADGAHHFKGHIAHPLIGTV